MLAHFTVLKGKPNTVLFSKKIGTDLISIQSIFMIFNFRITRYLRSSIDLFIVLINAPLSSVLYESLYQGKRVAFIGHPRVQYFMAASNSGKGG